MHNHQHTHSRGIQDRSPQYKQEGERRACHAVYHPPMHSAARWPTMAATSIKKNVCVHASSISHTPVLNPATFLSPSFYPCQIHHHSHHSHLHPSLSPHTLTVPWHFQLLQKPSILVESAAAMVLACMLGWVRERL